MVPKILYFMLSAGSLGLLVIDAPRGSLLTGSPESGKVERGPAGPGTTIRTPHYVFLGGFHGGK